MGAEEACGGQLVAGTLGRRHDAKPSQRNEPDFLIAHAVTTRGGHHHDPTMETFITHALNASEDGTGRGTPLVTAFSSKDHGADAGAIAPTLRAAGAAIAFHMTQDPVSGGVSPALGRTTSGMGMAVANLAQITSGVNRATEDGRPSPPLDGSGAHHLVTPMAVRRLLPVECERLQDLPDGWTDVPYRGKPAADGPRYEAIGNSIAVPCLRWLGERIAKVEQMAAARERAA